jgi:hypothetical protein
LPICLLTWQIPPQGGRVVGAFGLRPEYWRSDDFLKVAQLYLSSLRFRLTGRSQGK